MPLPAAPPLAWFPRAPSLFPGAAWLVDVRIGVVEVVTQLAPLGRVNVQAAQVGGGDPADVAGFVVAGRCPGDGAGEQDDLVFLTYLTVAVGDDVPGVGEDTQQPGDLDGDAGLFPGLPDRALGGGLAEFHLPHRQRPLPGVATAL